MILPFANSTIQKIDVILQNPNRVYLLYGDKYIGKYFTSRYIASQLLQDEKITHYDYVHPALYCLSKDIDYKAISIADVRSLTESIWHTSYSGLLRKVIIIRNIDKITESAANALLKNLEDTPEKTTIILTADNLQGVMPTIRSRSQLIYCRPDKSKAIDYLSRFYNVDVKQAEQFMEIANDRLFRAIENLDEQTYQNSKYIHNITASFIEGSITERFNIAKQVHDKKLGQEFLTGLIYATSKQSTILYDRLDFVESIMRALEQTRNNVNVRIAIENLALR